MRSFTHLNDDMGNRTHVVAQSDTILAVVLGDATPRQVAVPPDARLVLFSATDDFWARLGGSAALPTADVLDGSAPELNPGARACKGVGVIGLAAPRACVVSLSFFQ